MFTVLCMLILNSEHVLLGPLWAKVSYESCVGVGCGQLQHSGDSGSPLVMNETKPTAIGIVSFGSFRGCAAYRVPAVCTATSMYHDWILENMGEDAKDLCFVEKASQPSTPAEEQKKK